ncbi:MAG: cyanophycin synthetase [Actinomycetia bacterium]|nr:cyanophycin synthetase [Actinomycetes bacterium]
MNIVSYRYYAGPNIHCLNPVAEATVDLEDLAATPTNALGRFVDRLVAVLPGLSEHYCSRGRPGGFLERLREGTYLGHVVEHVALELLALAGEDVAYGKTRQVDDRVVRIVFESETRPGGLAALEAAVAAVEDLVGDRQEDWAERLAVVRDELAQYRLGPSTRAIVRAARERGIPVARLDGDSLVRLGQGAQQVRIRATLTERTPALAVDLAQDKAATKAALEAAAIPVPEGAVVTTEAQALAVLAGWGGPLVVKPAGGHQGDGVTMGIGTPAAMRTAFRLAASRGPVLVERQIPGKSYRCLVVGDRLVAASERIPPGVVGDGQRTVRDLVAQLNADPRRGAGHGFPLTRVALDAPALLHLAQQGLTPDSVVPAGRRVGLRAAANLSTGATARDVTDLVGPALAADVVRAARTIGLDVAGVDIVTPRLDVGLREAGGAVVEVNAAPGIRMHLYPDEGAPRDAGAAIVEHLFPPGRTGRIPVVAVTGTNGKTTVTRMIARVFEAMGWRTGMATTDGVWIGGRQVAAGDLTGPWSARLILDDRGVDAAVLETARGGIARGGLGFDDCDVGVVTNIGPDHLGQDGVETLEDLVYLKALVVEVVRPGGAAVLNADDPRVLGMAARTRGEVVLFSVAEDNLAIAKHLYAGGRAVFVHRGALIWGTGRERTRLVAVRSLRSAMGGLLTVNVANAAAAAAAALAAGCPPRVVAQALASFPPGGEGVNRGRLELVRGPDLTVLVDYGHNAPAVEAVGRICRALKRRPAVAVLGLPGDRRDADLVATARAVAQFADRVVVREDRDRRGRAPGAVAALLAGALMEAGLPTEAVEVVLDEGEAVRRAVATAPSDALVVVLFERYDVVQDVLAETLAGRVGPLARPASESG